MVMLSDRAGVADNKFYETYSVMCFVVDIFSRTQNTFTK